SWRSSRDGVIGTAASFSTSALSEGIHTIYFKVQDNNGVWSPEVHMIIGHLGCSVPVRIMPLGDSITFGYGEIPSTDLITGYRQPLYQALINADHYVDFSGGIYAGQSVVPLFDFDHEGHGGWGAKRVRPPYGGGIAPYIQSFLAANPSDIILLHIGTNDISDNAENPADVMEILSNIDLVSQDITVILARIISRNDGKALQTTQFNNAVEAAARVRIANGDKIIIVNQEGALNYSVDMWDMLHPNNAGYGKMANVWFDTLHGILPVCPQASASIISAIAGTGGTVSPAGAITVPSGNNQTFMIIPNSGYHISDVLVDNVSSGAISTYTFENVTANHTIQAVFAPDAPPQEIIIDNRDASVSYTGTWAISGASNPYAIDSVWSRDGTTYTWTFTPAVSGNYDLSM
ncbi:MAG: GDSL-type esterase/lipase family protein, partial [Nitrospirota bacterium]